MGKQKTARGYETHRKKLQPMGLEENGKTEEEHSFLAGGVNSAVQKFGFF
jgi:hypothetical protein